jgi:hypothetical protein
MKCLKAICLPFEIQRLLFYHRQKNDVVTKFTTGSNIPYTLQRFHVKTCSNKTNFQDIYVIMPNLFHKIRIIKNKGQQLFTERAYSWSKHHSRNRNWGKWSIHAFTFTYIKTAFFCFHDVTMVNMQWWNVTNTVEPGYNDIGLYASLIETDILWYELIRHC